MGKLSKTSPLVVTGAAGFIGRRVVAAARHRGIAVRAVLRGRSLNSWASDDGIKVIKLDLADADTADLGKVFAGAGAVIHAAGSLSGDEKRRKGEEATENLLAALSELGSETPHLIHVSSLAVYGTDGLHAGDTLDESTRLESRPEARDAYCRAKLTQERLVLSYVSETANPVSILRPGAVFGAGRVWNGHLGIPLGRGLLAIGSTGQVPLCFVDHCAEALVRTAEHTPIDAPEVFNLLDSDLPERAEYINALKSAGILKWALGISWPLTNRLAQMTSTLPLIGPRAPGLFRPATLRARLMPLRYSNAVMRARLGWTPPLSFAEAMERALPRGER